MFLKRFDDLMISEVTTPQSGKVLCADYAPTNTTIFMDVKSKSMPDGVNTYLIGNKILRIVHWEDVTDEDIQATMYGTLHFRAGNVGNEIYTPGQFMFGKFGTYRWGYDEVFPGLMPAMNNLEKPFDEMIVLLVNSNDLKVLGSRTVTLPQKLGYFIAQGNINSLRHLQRCCPMGPRVSNMRELVNLWNKIVESHFTPLYQSNLSALSTASGICGLDVDEEGVVHYVKF